MFTKIHKVDKIPVTNWSKPDQLVISENGHIVITTGDHNGENFTGFRISDGVSSRFSNYYIKAKFSLAPNPIAVTLFNK